MALPPNSGLGSRRRLRSSWTLVLAVGLVALLTVSTFATATAAAAASPPSSPSPPPSVPAPSPEPAVASPSDLVASPQLVAGGPDPTGPTVCPHPSQAAFEGQIVVSPGNVATPGAPVVWSGSIAELTGPVNGSILDLASDVIIDGSGCSLHYASIAGTGNETGIEVRDATNVTVENFPITANGSDYGAFVGSSSFVTVTNVAAEGESTAGLEASSSASVDFTGNDVDDSGGTGVSLSQVAVALAERNSANGSALGFWVGGTLNATLLSNYAVGTSGDAFDTIADVGTYAADNDFSGAGGYDADLSESLDAVLEDNNLSGTSPTGLYVPTTTGAISILGNDLTGGHQNGVQLGDVVGSITISGNRIENSTQVAIELTGSGNTLTIEDNDLSTNGSASPPVGISIGGALTDALLISGNRMDGGVAFGIIVQGQIGGPLTVSGNDVTDAVHGAFAAMPSTYTSFYGPITFSSNDFSTDGISDAPGILFEPDSDVLGSIWVEGNNLTGGYYDAFMEAGHLSGNASFLDNDVANATSSAIEFDYGVGGNLLVQGNDIAANATSSLDGPDGVDIENFPVTGTTTIVGNNLSGGLYGAIVINPYVPVEDEYPYAPLPTGSVFVVDNLITNVTDLGIYVYEIGGNLVVVGNDFAANATTFGEAEGIYLDWSVEAATDGSYGSLVGSLIVEGNDFRGLLSGVDEEGFVEGDITIVGNDFANETGGSVDVSLEGYYNPAAYGTLDVAGNNFTANASTLGAQTALAVYGVDGTTSVFGNDMSGGLWEGIWLHSLNTATVSYNDVGGTVEGALQIFDSGTVTVVGNNLSANATTVNPDVYGGLLLYDINEVTVVGNDVSGGQGYGIWVYSAFTADIIDNNASGTTVAGITVNETAVALITGNDVSSSAGTAIVASSDDNLTATDNLLWGSATGFNLSEIDGPIALSGNDVSASGIALDLEGSGAYYATIEANNFSASTSVTVNGTSLNFIGNDLLGTPDVNLTNDEVYLFDHNDLDTSFGSDLNVTGSVPVTGSFNSPLPTGGNYWSGCAFSNVTGGIGSPPCPVGSYEDLYPLAQPWFSYAITFVETGLATSTVWSVSIPGVGTLSGPAPAPLEFFPQNGATVTYPFTVGPAGGLTPVPSSGAVVADGTALTVPITFTSLHAVTFTETGLPSGAAWSVVFNGTPAVSTAPTAIVYPTVANGTYAFTVVGVAGYIAEPTSGTLPVSGPTEKAITFTAAPPGTYTVNVSESGLPSGTFWTVTLNGTPMSATAPGPIYFSGYANGSYLYAVGGIAGYVASPASGTVAVSGATSLNITFTPIPSSTYIVTFFETGLPVGTAWSATFNGTTESTTAPSAIPFSGYPNGTYGFSIGGVDRYTATPDSGAIRVSGNTTVNVTFAPPLPGTYSVDFTETGLPGGTVWSVNFNGSTHAATSPAEISFAGFPPGSYNYSVLSVVGYLASPDSGAVDLTGNASVAIDFSAVPVGTYTLTFTETGLLPGTSWSLTFNGTPTHSTSPSIVFQVPNGTYAYAIDAVGSWVVLSLGSGSLTVLGSNLTRTVVFSYTSTVTFTQTSIPNGTTWTIAATLDAVPAPSEARILAGSLVGQTWYTNSSGPTARLHLTNGTYTWTITASGYQTNSGSFSVSGTPTTVAVSTSPSPASGGIAWWIWAALAAAIVLVIVAGALLLLRRRGGRRSAPPPSPEPETIPATDVPASSTSGSPPPAAPPPAA